METLTLAYTPHSGDLADAVAHSPRLRRSRNRALRNAVCSLLFTAVFGVVEVGVPESPPGTLLLTLLFAALFASYLRTVLILSTRWGVRRLERRVWRRRGREAAQPHEAEVAGTGLTVRTQHRSCSYAWAGFGGMVETDHQFLLLGTSGEPSISLPKRGLADPSLIPDCRRMLTEHLTPGRPPHSAGLAGDGALG